MGRIVVETSTDRRVTREYDDEGRLVRVLVEPVMRGPTPDLPPVERQPSPPRAAKKEAKREPKAAVPAPPAGIVPPPKREEELPVVLAPYEEKPVAATAPLPPPPAPQSKRFEIVAVERVEPAAPQPVVAPPEPPVAEPAPLEASLDKANEALGSLPEAPAAPVPQPEPEPEPQPAAPLVVADLEDRVDALFAERARSSKSKKRAPLPVPQFEPLKREPWEDRLERALSDA